MIRLIIILLALTYFVWIIYRLFVNERSKQKKLPFKIIISIILLLLALFLLPKLGLLSQKLIPLLTNPLGIFQMIVQKVLPLISILRGILPF